MLYTWEISLIDEEAVSILPLFFFFFFCDFCFIVQEVDCWRCSFICPKCALFSLQHLEDAR